MSFRCFHSGNSLSLLVFGKRRTNYLCLNQDFWESGCVTRCLAEVFEVSDYHPVPLVELD